MMRTNIVLDDSLVAEALELTGTKSKKEVIHLALLKLIESEKNKNLDHANFIATYIDQPVKIEHFTPLQRDESHER
jgi:Arc/MetJ family transcription regulator